MKNSELKIVVISFSDNFTKNSESLITTPNEVKFWLTIYSYFNVSMIMVIIIKKNKYVKKSQRIIK